MSSLFERRKEKLAKKNLHLINMKIILWMSWSIIIKRDC